MTFETFGTIEWMAFILIVISAIKIIVILVSPKAWSNNVVKKLWANPILMSIVSLILAAGALYYLDQAGITIVQILAIALFVALLIAIGVGIYAKELIKVADRVMKDKSLLKKAWLYIIIWIALLVWGAVRHHGQVLQQ